MKLSRFSDYILPTTIFLFAIFCGYINFRAGWFGIDKHFSLLAQSFLKNDLFLSPLNLPDGDFVDYLGRQYLFFGPLPSIILMPFVFVVGKNFPQINLSIASLVVTYIATFMLSRKLQFSKVSSFWLSNFFVFGTVLYFVGLINISAYIPQAVGTALFMLSLLEYFSKKRWLVIGLLVGAAGATRITLFGISVFFLLEIYRTRNKLDIKKSLALFMIPVLFSMSMLAIYNFRRFHSVFETGYTKNVSILDKDYYNYKEGFFSPVHIPANLYSLLLMAPEPIKKEHVEFVLQFPYLKANGFGMAIWFTSPLFLFLFRAKKKPYVPSAATAIVFLAIPSLLYWGIGAAQFGYRYSLDFLPLLFLILTTSFKKELPLAAKIIITFGIIFNCFYMMSIWSSYDPYPLLNMFSYLKISLFLP